MTHAPRASELPVALEVTPHYVAKPWGGRRLETALGRTDLPAGPVGESWEVADTAQVTTRVATGPLAGRTLSEILGAPFPLLVKVIDAREDLSVQVHPDGRDGPAAKEEAWVALADGGAVAVGLDPRARAGVPWLERLGRRTLVGAGGARPPSLVHVPAGTVHAILAGSLVWEVQTPVDVTWRLDDFGRTGLDGRPRALHLVEAASVLARGPEARGREEGGGRSIVGKRFRLDLHPPGTSARGAACVAFFPGGGVVAGAAPGEDVAVAPGRSAVLTVRARALRSPGWVFTASVATPGLH
jgi:mannose-6-phosphate isomerase